MKIKDQKAIPKWLKRLQENSWEMEILISGGAIFSLFQLSDFYIEWIQQVRMTNPLPGIGMLLMLGMFGLKILTLGFTLHLVSRGFWLSLVCINDVFPKGLKPRSIQWRSPFKSVYKGERDLKDQIISADKTCGTIMYLSIVAAFAIIGLALLVIFLSTILYFFEFETLAPILLILFLIYVFDLLLFGLLRKTPLISYLIYPLFRLFDFISLRRFYQKSLWVFNTNIKKVKFSLLALLFLFVAFIFTFNSIYQIQHWPNILDDRDYSKQLADDYRLTDILYMDSWNYEQSIPFGISSKVVRGNLLEFYLRYDKDYDYIISKSDSLEENRSFHKLIDLQIDNKVVKDVNWLSAIKPNQDLGIATILDLSSYADGRHTLTFTLKEKFQKEKYLVYFNHPIRVDIPFWIDRPFSISNNSTE